MYGNTERNYAVRIMLLASAGNPHRRKNINAQEFDDLINAYHNWDRHSISDSRILNEEAEALSNCIRTWESNNEKIVRNWSLRLSEILDLSVINQNVVYLFTQCLAALQNAGFGKPISRIERTIKFIELLEKNSNKKKYMNFQSL